MHEGPNILLISASHRTSRVLPFLVHRNRPLLSIPHSRSPRDSLHSLFPLRFASADPPAFLDYEGCEFLLISASEDIASELGAGTSEEVEEDVPGECKGWEECKDVLKSVLGGTKEKGEGGVESVIISIEK